MPRMGRVVLPGYPHHVVQRGHDRNAVFACDADYWYYLDNLAELKADHGVRVFAFCLMSNHVHLLLAPSDTAGLGQLMKPLAGRQTRYRNRLEGRSGTLWEGRYKSSLVESDAYLLACVRYIELNPVRARMVADPGDYAWSSFAARVGAADAAWLDRIPGMGEPGDDTADAAGAHAAYIRSAIPEGEWDLIRRAAARGQLTGSQRFVDEVNRITGKRVLNRGPGRPRKRIDE